MPPSFPVSLDAELGLAPPTSYPDIRPFRAVVSSEVRLAVSPEDAWQRLVSFKEYGAWNPFTKKADAELKEGAAVTLEVHGLAKRAMTRVEYLHSIVPGRRICWGMNMGPLLRANRTQWLKPLPDGGTLYRTDDVLTGLLTPLVMFLYGKKMQAGFDGVCRGLAESFSASAVLNDRASEDRHA